MIPRNFAMKQFHQFLRIRKQKKDVLTRLFNNNRCYFRLFLEKLQVLPKNFIKKRDFLIVKVKTIRMKILHNDSFFKIGLHV